MTLFQILASGTGVLALLAAATLLLPRHVDVSRQANLAASSQDVIALATSNVGYQSFNPYKSSDPDLAITPFGPDTGVGSGFKFEGREGKGTQTVADVTPTSVRYAIDLGAMGQPEQIIQTAQNGDMLNVTWTMQADMGFNPIGRVMGVFMDGMVGPKLETGLTNLDKALKL